MAAARSQDPFIVSLGCFLGALTFDPIAQAQSDHTLSCPVLDFVFLLYIFGVHLHPIGEHFLDDLLFEVVF